VAKSKKTTVTTVQDQKGDNREKSRQPHEDHGQIKNQYKTVSLKRRMGQQQDRRSSTERRQKDIPVAVEHRVCERRRK